MAHSLSQENKAWNNVARWEQNKRRTVNKPLAKARRLQSYGEKAGYDLDIVGTYSEDGLRKQIKMDYYATLACLVSMTVSGILALSEVNFFIITIFSVWFATIAYRFYKHHLKCLAYLSMLNAQKCPHCGMALASVNHPVETTIVKPRHIQKKHFRVS